jgi:hypothetical protein
MSDELTIGVVEGEVLSLLAAADGPRAQKKAKLKGAAQGSRSDESCSAGLVTGRESKSGSSPGLRPTRNDKTLGERLRPTRIDRDLRAMTPKELGEMAEAKFLTRALEMGIGVAKPWGESRGYDFIVDDEGKLNRVQVKAAFSEGRQGSYSLRAYRSSKRSYTKKDIDVMAGYVNAKDAWYLFPVR